MSTNKNGMAAELKVMPLLGKIIELCVTSGTQLMCNICGIVVQINYCANSIVQCGEQAFTAKDCKFSK